MKKIFGSLLIVLILSIISLTSCEVGLGSSVDVESPKITITYPPASAVVRDSFVLAGTCSDDKSVSKIIVNIFSTGNGQTTAVENYDFSDPVITDGKKWTVTLNELVDGKYPLKDGKYSIEAYAIDSSSRESGKYTLAVEIDNTAPLFVIQTPGSDETETHYGSIFKVRGSVAEDHKLKYMTLSVFDSSNKLLKSWTENDVDISGTTSVTFARYRASESRRDELHQAYCDIYDVTKSGAQSFKISLRLADNAGIWRTPVYEESTVEADDANDSTSGNFTSCLWLNDSINGNAAGENNLLGNNSSNPYEIGSLLKILNDTSTFDESEIQRVKGILENSKLDTEESKLLVSLNKEANPTYEIGGYSFSASDLAGQAFSNEAFKNGTITLKADYGLDETTFLKSTIKVYLAGPFSKDQITQDFLEEIYDNPEAYVLKNSSQVEENGRTRSVLADGLRCISDNTENTEASVTNCSISIKLPEDIISQKYYLVFVTGSDQDGLEFLPANGYYGFKGGSSGSAPHVEIQSPDSGEVSNQVSVLKASGLVTSDENDPINTLRYEVIVSDVLNKNKYLGTISGYCASTEGEFGKDSSIKWEMDASKGVWTKSSEVSEDIDGRNPSEGSVYEYIIKVIGTTEHEGYSNLTVRIDKKLPEVKIASVGPYAELSEDQKDYFVNGIITITGNISDSNLESVQLVISDSGDMIKTINLSDQTYFSENINTGIFSSGLPKGRLTISLSARDKAGNSNIIEEKSYIVNQTTDLPKITLSDSDLTLDTKEKLENAINEGKTGNLFDQSSRIKVSFSDDDKVDSYSVQYTKDITSASDKIPEESWILLASGSISSLSKTLEVELKEKEGKKSLEDGLYRMRISAKDIKADEKSAPVTKTTEPFFFAIDTKEPVIEITKVLSAGREIQAQDGTYYVKDGCTIFGKVSEKYLLSFTGNSEPLELTADSQLSDVFDFQLYYDKDKLKDEATNKISFKATDKITHSASEQLSIYLDTTAPKTSISIQPLVSLTETQGSEVVTIDYYVNGEIVVKANASDKDKVLSSRVALYDAEGTFIKDIYTIDETLAEGLQSPDSFDRYIDTTDSSIYTDNTEYTVKIFSKDRAGNETSESDAASKKIFVKQETDRPVVTVSNADAASIIGARGIAAGKNLFNDTTNNKLSFSVSDDDGIMSFEVKCYKVHLNEGDSGFTVDSEEFVNSNYVTPSYQAGARTFSYNYILPAEEGIYKIQAIAHDINYDSSDNDEQNTYFVNTDTEDDFWYVAVDAGAPKLILNRQSGSFMAKDEAFNLDLTAEDSSGYVKVYRYAGKTVGDVYYSAKELSNRREKGNPVLDEKGKDVAENSFEVSQTGTNATKATDIYTSSQVGHESRVIYYVAEDKYNQTTTVSFNYKIDELSPTLYSEWTGQSEADQKWTKITNYTYSIPLSDAWDNVAGKSLIEDGIQKYSGISNVEINIYKEGVAEPKTSSMNKGNKVDKDHDDTKGAFYEYYTVDSTYVNGDGVYTATVTAKDDSGQSATFANIFTNKIDTTAPHLGQEDGDISLSDKNNTSGQDFTKIDAVKYNLLSESNPLVLQAKAHDLSSGISRIEIKDKFGSSENTIYDTSAHSDYVNVSSTHTGLANSPVVSETDETYTFEISKNLVETGNHTYTVIFYDAAGNFSSESINMISDITSPSIQLNAPSPFVNVKENEQSVTKYNGKITVSGTVTDETELGTSSDEVTWKVFTAANTSSTVKASGNAELNGTKSSSFSFDIDTTQVTTESGTYYLLVTAKDKAGNTQDSANYQFIELNIDQTTDVPVIHLSNATAGLTDKNEISTDVNKNLFGSGNPALIGTITDDDGIESVEFYIDGTAEANRVKKAVSNGNGGTEYVSYLQITEQTTSVSFQLDFSQLTQESNSINFTAGDHTLYIKVLDTSSGLSSEKYIINDGTVDNANGSVRAMAFAYDTKTPTINVEKVEFEGEKKAYASGMWLPKEFDIWFTVSDDTFDSTASVNFGNNDGENDENRYKLLYVKQESVSLGDGSAYSQASSEVFRWASYSESEKKWVFHVVNSETSYNREFTVADKYGRYSSVSVNYKVDATKPVFNSDYIKIKGNITSANGNSSAQEIAFNTAVSSENPVWFTGEAITISGYGDNSGRALTETNPEKLTLTLNGTDFSMTTDSQNNNKFGATISFEQGLQTASLVAEDGAGNKSESLTLALSVDSIAPVISSVTAKKSELSIIDKVIKKTDAFAVSVTALEETSGIKGIYIGTKAGFALAESIGSYTVPEEASASEIVKTFNITPSALTDGSYTLYARVVDIAGNYSEDYQIGKITIDSQKPEVSISSPVSASLINKDAVITGSVSDANLDADSGLPELYVWVASGNSGSWKKADSQYGNQTVKSASRIGENWSITLDTRKINSSSTSTSSLYFAVQFTDLAGNSNSLPELPSASDYKLTVDQNSDRPLISLSGINRSGSSLKSNGNIYGTVNDDDGDLKGLWFIKSSAFNPSSPKYPSLSNNNGWTKLEISNKSWQAEEASEGASITWYFYAIDKNDGLFSSLYTDKLQGLYIKGNTDENPSEDYKASGVTSGISFNVDMNPPEITEVKIARKLLDYDAAGWSTATDTFGPDSSSLYIQITVKEGLGMKKTDSGDYEAPAVYIGSREIAASVRSQNGVIKEEASAGDEDARASYIYLFDPIDLSAVTPALTGSNTVKVIVKDSSGFTGQGTIGINYDTNAPEVKIVSPTTKMEDAVTGSISIKGLSQDDYSSLLHLYYLIPLKNVEYSQENLEEITGWNEIAASTSWEIKFASGAADSTDSLIYYANAQTNGQATYKIEETGSEGIYKVPLYFKVVDSVGNKGLVTDQYLLVDKDGGKPNAWINTPEKDATTSGKVTVYGGASDNVSVGEVQLQIDANNDGNFTLADYNLIKNDSLWSESEANANLKIYGSASANADNWYIACTGTNSWKTIIDTNAIPAVNGKTYLRMRVRAFDEESTPQTREWTTDSYVVNIDANVPVISDLKLVQYGLDAGGNSLSSGTVVTEREYISGMYISNITALSNGDWYLTGKVSDNANVSSITFSNLTSNTTNVVPIGASDITGNNSAVLPLNIRLDTSHSGMIYCDIVARDNSTGETHQEIKINIDSTSPSMYTYSGSETTNASNLTDALRLKSQSVKIGSGDSDATVQNSNSYFTFGDVVSEGGSGLKFIAFDFVREGSSENRSYDPMVTSEGNANKIVIGTTPGTSVTRNSDGLLSRKLTVTRNSEDSLESSSLTSYISNGLIRKGGLVKIAGTYSTILSASGSKITFSPTVSTDYTSAEVIFACLVDHQLTESVDSDGSVVNDDGDGMIESIVQIGSSYQWSASVNSTNIPDGPVVINVVAMDNAGNLIKGSISTSVSNNRPRIAKVLLGTDLNGNGKYDYRGTGNLITNQSAEHHLDITSDFTESMTGAARGEFSYYPALSATNAAQSSVQLDSSAFKVVSGLVLVPEFVGGNNGIGYIVSKDTSASLEKKTGSVTSLTSKAAFASSVSDLNDSYPLSNEVSEFGALVIANGSSLVSGSGSCYYNFTFWDKTEETSQGSTSQWATLSVPVTLSTNETNAPLPKIKPFYWNGADSNSVLIKEAGDSEKKIKGHIELEGALPAATGLTAGLPKVSGKVKIEGKVFDDVRISSISMSIFGGTNTVVANYTSGSWTQAASLPSGVVSFSAEDEDISQNGHSVKYTAVIDTESLNLDGYPVGANQTIKITATDWKSNSSTAGSSQTARSSSGVSEAEDTGANWTDCYKMDVVPYVSEIVTHLSSFYRQAHSVYARTAKGNYPVYEGEVIQFVGYNLGTNKAKVTVNGMSETTLANGSVGGSTVSNTLTLTKNTSTSVTGAKSGSVTVKVNTIPAMNNINTNDAKGSYSGNVSDSNYRHAYNRQPNGVNNNILTDDLALDVWQFKNAAEPVSGGALFVNMKINPKTGTPGFSFANSILYFNMPGYNSDGGNASAWGAENKTVAGTNYSQIPFGMNYGGFSHNSFTFDSFGYAYGAAMCTDTSKAVESAFFQFFSRETPIEYSTYNQNMNYCNSANASRLDSSSLPLNSDTTGWTTDINRIQSISMDTSYAGAVNTEPSQTTPVYVFMAYYDQPVKQVRFRWGTVGDASDNIDGKDNSTDSNSFNSGKVANAYGLNDFVSGQNSYSKEYTGFAQAAKTATTRPNNLKDSFIYYSNTKNSGIPIQVVAASGVTGARSEYASAKNGGAGKYVSLSIANKDTANPVAIVTWYDEVSMALKMAYNTAPTTGNTWTVRTIDSNGGINVKTVVDGDNHIHFAYYDNINGSDLKYAYLDSYNSASAPAIVTVDSFSAVGAKCTIDVAKDASGNWVPYIGYQLSSYLGTPLGAKIAYRTDFTSLKDGAIDDLYTGAWESSIVPTQSIPNDDQINVGIWRAQAAVTVSSTSYAKNQARPFNTSAYWSTGDTAPGQTISNGVLNVGNATLLHGNNTANPILGYGIDTGAIEMAQKK